MKLAPVRRETYRDLDGLLTYFKDEDSTRKDTVDWTGLLDSGETVSSVAVDADGITVTHALASSVSTLTVTKTDGTVQLQATTSNSRVLVQTVAYRGITK